MVTANVSPPSDVAFNRSSCKRGSTTSVNLSPLTTVASKAEEQASSFFKHEPNRNRFLIDFRKGFVKFGAIVVSVIKAMSTWFGK